MENHNRSFEPMDVDVSANSNSKMDISYDNFSVEMKQGHDVDIVNTSQAIAENNIKKFHIIIQKNEKCRNVMKIRIFITMFTLLTSIVVFNILNINCSVEVNLDNLRNTLSNQLIGQSKAIDSIIEFLKEKGKSRIMFLYGGTGVGKTFAASLLMDNFGYSSNLYHYTLQSFVKSMSSNLMMGLILCPNSLIIVDDCNIADMSLPKEVNDLIIKSENLGKYITVILIYNCDNIGENFVKRCDENFNSKLFKSFNIVKTKKKFIKFEPLSEIHLRKCIEKEIGNKSIDEDDYEIISKDFDVAVDGCKGVHTKIRLLNIM